MSTGQKPECKIGWQSSYDKGLDANVVLAGNEYGKAGEIMAHELLLKGGHIVTVDDSLGNLPEGDVLIKAIRSWPSVVIYRHLPGKQADVTVIDMQSPHLDGYGEAIATMVLGASPADVETVIVGGDIIKRDGQLVGEHISKARELMLASRKRLRAR